MRTTVRLPDPILRRAKKYAESRGMTLTAVLLEGLRIGMSRRGRGPAKSRPIVMPSFHGTGVRPGVDLTCTSSLLARTEKFYGTR